MHPHPDPRPRDTAPRLLPALALALALALPLPALAQDAGGGGGGVAFDPRPLCAAQGLPSSLYAPRFGVTEASLCPGEGAFEARSVIAAKDGRVAFGRLMDTQGNYLDEIAWPARVESYGVYRAAVTYFFQPVTLPPDPSGGPSGNDPSGGESRCAYAYGSTCLVAAGSLIWTTTTLTTLVMGPFSVGAASAAAVFGLFGAALLALGVVLATALGPGALEEAKGVLAELGQTVGEIVDAIVDAVAAAVDAVVDFFKDLFGVEDADDPLPSESASASSSDTGSTSASETQSATASDTQSATASETQSASASETQSATSSATSTASETDPPPPEWTP